MNLTLRCINFATDIQWNLCLYDDEVLYVVPGSHTRLNTAAENEQMKDDDQVPLPGAIQTKLNAGDAAVYLLPILHWGSNYSTKIRRTIHGGFSEFSHYPGLPDYIQTLRPAAQAMFRRWDDRSRHKMALTAAALRAAAGLGPPGLSYDAALDQLHGGGAASRRHSTACLSKQARRVYSLANDEWGLRWGYADNSEELERNEALSMHPQTLQWGGDIAALFSPEEAAQVWAAFRPVDEALAASFAAAQAACAGFGRNDGSYNSTMPPELQPTLPPPLGRL
jgi:hypothetical protein